MPTHFVWQPYIQRWQAPRSKLNPERLRGLNFEYYIQSKNILKNKTLQLWKCNLNNMHKLKPPKKPSPAQGHQAAQVKIMSSQVPAQSTKLWQEPRAALGLPAIVIV